MKINRSIVVCWLALIILLCWHAFAAAQRGQITGRVTDSETGKGLPGANILLKGTSIGTASDLNGFYNLSNVPPGTYEIIVRYIGYEEVTFSVQVSLNERVKHDVKMIPQAVRGETVIVTAQAEAQLQAINQQLSAKTIKNVVSRKQIQELPEANAAEAVGRLPGVSLERSGGEGNKVIIRGMAAKYSLIQIDGVNMTATGEEDRSTDLSMISPYMLEGIELTKSVMANQEATATGGIVNFRIKKAPETTTFNLISQGGYNSLRNTYRDFKISTGGSTRFFSNLLGTYAQIDYEEKDAGSQQLGGVSFSQDNESEPVRTHSMQLMDIFRRVKRLGATLVMDFGLPSTEFKFSNFFSRINREETRYQNNYDFTQQGFSLNYSDTPKSWLTVLTNSFQMDHRWRNWEINSIFSHSYSENILPARISSSNNNSPNNPFPTNRKSNFNVDLDPETIPDSLVISMDEAAYFMHLGGMDHEESKTHERDLAAELHVSYNFRILDKLNVKLGFGGKYKHKSKDYDRTTYTASNYGGDQEYRNLIYKSFEPELSDRTKEAWSKDNMRILLIDFLDKNYEGGKFLKGRYDFGNVFDKEKFRRIHEIVMATFDPTNTNDYQIVWRNFINSTYYDYNGIEDYHAFYLMPEINIGPQILLVPGVRYEANRTEYTGYRGNRLGVIANWRPTPVDTVTKVRHDEFLLPMIQSFFKPTYWLTFKAGYTHTLQRPNYNNIMPGWVISTQGQIYNLSNFRLRPELSRNWDIQVSLHSNKIGLFSIGGFHKKITDMIFWTGQKVITDTAYFELPTIMNRQRAAWATNNENPVYNKGYEVEWQSNLWYLPGMLKGLVINVNYTYNKSKAKYLRTRIKTIVDPKTYRFTLVNEDTTYKSPMIMQPDHLLNLTLGYDYRGFSIRWAMRFMSHVFKAANWYEKLRGYSTDFYRYDLSVRQKLPIRGLELFLNVNNLTNEVEKDVINHMHFANYIEDYGRNANIGLRYQY
ncbi:MAG: carboxypeptidase-like regulatory domain-containing protein [candidate division KSB1 bacterium]|nr:carboxypeptidase-like regulatory domain-containing protein [candidate division KSB1 bacterium]MDZ7334380.1 carboxypeptidase-like regulatory domain-containing protein [candidate division KSB1 bacterium]MDZ7358270.1 carboxypeptidase-like regulatory domain-containing protein [candidate division KSB1 bacterium]MDZ7398813.1 carboxypeptidase-like regulatory domain-containing protein [candidate division KSB1 bacterium]